MQIFPQSQASATTPLLRTDSTKTASSSSSRRPSTKDTDSNRRPSTKPASLQLSPKSRKSSTTSQSTSTSTSILNSLNKKLDRFLDEIRETGFILRGSKYLSEAEENRSLPPTPCSSKTLELTYLIPKPLETTEVQPRRKLSRPAEAWSRMASKEYRFT